MSADAIDALGMVKAHVEKRIAFHEAATSGTGTTLAELEWIRDGISVLIKELDGSVTFHAPKAGAE